MNNKDQPRPSNGAGTGPARAGSASGMGGGVRRDGSDLGRMAGAARRDGSGAGTGAGQQLQQQPQRQGSVSQLPQKEFWKEQMRSNSLVQGPGKAGPSTVNNQAATQGPAQPASKKATPFASGPGPPLQGGHPPSGPGGLPGMNRQASGGPQIALPRVESVPKTTTLDAGLRLSLPRPPTMPAATDKEKKDNVKSLLWKGNLELAPIGALAQVFPERLVLTDVKAKSHHPHPETVQLYQKKLAKHKYNNLELRLKDLSSLPEGTAEQRAHKEAICRAAAFYMGGSVPERRDGSVTFKMDSVYGKKMSALMQKWEDLKQIMIPQDVQSRASGSFLPPPPNSSAYHKLKPPEERGEGKALRKHGAMETDREDITDEERRVQMEIARLEMEKAMEDQHLQTLADLDYQSVRSSGRVFSVWVNYAAPATASGLPEGAPSVPSTRRRRVNDIYLVPYLREEGNLAFVCLTTSRMYFQYHPRVSLRRARSLSLQNNPENEAARRRGGLKQSWNLQDERRVGFFMRHNLVDGEPWIVAAEPEETKRPRGEESTEDDTGPAKRHMREGLHHTVLPHDQVHCLALASLLNWADPLWVAPYRARLLPGASRPSALPAYWVGGTALQPVTGAPTPMDIDTGDRSDYQSGLAGLAGSQPDGRAKQPSLAGPSSAAAAAAATAPVPAAGQPGAPRPRLGVPSSIQEALATEESRHNLRKLMKHIWNMKDTPLEAFRVLYWNDAPTMDDESRPLSFARGDKFKCVKSNRTWIEAPKDFDMLLVPKDGENRYLGEQVRRAPHPDQLRSLQLHPCRMVAADPFLRELCERLGPVDAKGVALSPSPAFQDALRALWPPKHDVLSFGVNIVMDSRPWMHCPTQLLARLCVLVKTSQLAHEQMTFGIKMRTHDMQHVAMRGSDEAAAVMFSAMEAGLLTPCRTALKPRGPTPPVVADAVTLMLIETHVRFTIAMYCDPVTNDPSRTHSPAVYKEDAAVASAAEKSPVYHGSVEEVVAFLEHLYQYALVAPVV